MAAQLKIHFWTPFQLNVAMHDEKSLNSHQYNVGRIEEGHFGPELKDIGLMSFQEKVRILAKQHYGRNQSSQIHGHVRADPWTAQRRTAMWGRNKLLFFTSLLFFSLQPT